MYENYFGLEHKPFAITPDPRALFLSDRHREALAHLLYGVGEGGGFVQLTGEVGTGKTTLCRSLLEQLPADVDPALILNPRLDAIELVAAICDELKVPYPAGCTSLKVLVAALNEDLLRNHAAGRRTVLIIDEAQNLAPEVLEQVRLLTNLETAEIKLLQIILIGQPELRRLLERDELRQLAQRITARYHLEPLNRQESWAYMRHRLRVAGVERSLFTPGAMRALYRLSGGVPRLLNIIADRALLGAYVEERDLVNGAILRRAAREVLAESGGRSRFYLAPARSGRYLAVALLLLLLLPAGLLMGHRLLFGPDFALGELAFLAPGRPAAGERVVPSGSAIELAAHLATLDDGSEAAAWDALYELWGEKREGEDDGCVQAQLPGLRCLEGSGNWTVLRHYDRPALLRLVVPGSRKARTILLTGLDRQEAVVRLAGEELRLPLAELERHWFGDYRLLWRSPLQGELLREGDRGADVPRLRAALKRLELLLPEQSPERPSATGTDPAYFDPELTRRVKAFQGAAGLQPDGIVGLQTLLRLSAELGESDAPRLAAGRPADRQERENVVYP